jgi:predicted nucleic-acid-binding Zn-ribbon protein
MPQTVPRCPKCQKSMEEGHVPDIAHGQVHQSQWAPGAAEIRRFLGGIKWSSKEQIPLTAFRCPSCGYVELYAPLIEPG